MGEEGSPRGAAGGPPPVPGIPAWFLLLAVGASGAAVMTVEMTAVRALQPFFGSTTFVWTNVIAVVLAALALGYDLGGRLADRRASPGLLFGLLAAGGLLVALGALLVTPVSRLFLDEGVSLEGLSTVLVKGSLGTSLLLFAPPLLLLGAVCPIAIRLLASRGAGRAAGRVFAVSTVGSIAGTYLPTLLLVPHLGSRGSLLAAAGLLLLPAAAGLAAFARPRSAAVAAGAVALLAGGSLAALGDTRPSRGPPPLPGGGDSVVLAERESPYQYLTVRDDRHPGEPPRRVLTINEGVHTFHALRVEGRVLADSRCYDDYAMLPFLLDLAPGSELRAAVVGFACGVNASQWRHFWDGPYRLRVDGAELDPEVLALGREFFGLPAGDGGDLRVTVADGRPWLEALPAGTRYHMLVLDAFAHELYVPFHLGTREFFDLCRRRLLPGGVLAMNVYAVGADSPNLRALENTLATSFGSCVRASQYRGANFMLLARNGEGPPDLARLARERTGRRFPGRGGLREWDRLLDLAAAVPEGAVVVTPRPDAPVLTDDHAPLEWLTDRFLGLEERRLLGDDAAGADPGDSARRAALRALDARQGRVLAWIGAGWALLLGGLFLLSRRLP